VVSLGPRPAAAPARARRQLHLQRLRTGARRGGRPGVRGRSPSASGG
jgi:hypothetical protein